MEHDLINIKDFLVEQVYNDLKAFCFYFSLKADWFGYKYHHLSGDNLTGKVIYLLNNLDAMGRMDELVFYLTNWWFEEFQGTSRVFLKSRMHEELCIAGQNLWDDFEDHAHAVLAFDRLATIHAGFEQEWREVKNTLEEVSLDESRKKIGQLVEDFLNGCREVNKSQDTKLATTYDYNLIHVRNFLIENVKLEEFCRILEDEVGSFCIYRGLEGDSYREKTIDLIDQAYRRGRLGELIFQLIIYWHEHVQGNLKRLFQTQIYEDLEIYQRELLDDGKQDMAKQVLTLLKQIKADSTLSKPEEVIELPLSKKEVPLNGMELPVILQHKIIDFLKSLPNIDDTKSRQAFIYSAGLDSQLKDQIPFDEPPAQFIPLLVSILINYGELNDGRSPLETVLKAAKNYVGQDRQEYCKILIQEFKKFKKEFVTQKEKQKQKKIFEKVDSIKPHKQVFISYAREDQVMAKKICQDLKREGIKTWIDSENLLPGQNWKATITQEIKDCSHFLALLSSHSISKKGFVQKELKIAIEVLDEIPETEIYLIPVRLDECEPKNEILQELHWVDLFPSYEEGLKTILRVFYNRVQNEPAFQNSSSLNKYLRLMHEAESNWIEFYLLPEPRILYLFHQNISIEELPIEHLAFLWCVWHVMYDAMDKWCQKKFGYGSLKHRLNFSFEPFERLLLAHANTITPILNECEIGQCLTISKRHTDENGGEYTFHVLAQLLLAPKVNAIYCMKRLFRSEKGLEVIVRGESELSVKIRHIGVNFSEECTNAYGLIHDKLDKVPSEYINS